MEVVAGEKYFNTICSVKKKVSVKRRSLARGVVFKRYYGNDDQSYVCLRELAVDGIGFY